MSAVEFVTLRSSRIPEDYWRAAHEEAPMAVWLDVIEHYPAYRKWVAHNKTVPLEILRLLAKDDDRGVRSWVAEKRKLTPDLLEQLASDPDENIRAQIARHRKASPELLRKMIARENSAFVISNARAHLERMASFDNKI